MGALHFCSALCPLWRDAGRRRVAVLAQSLLDRSLHGNCPVGRHGLQPLGGCRPGRCQSANRSAGDSGRPTQPTLRRRLYRGDVLAFVLAAASSTGRHSCFLPWFCGAPALLLHQEIHPLVSPGARPGPGDCSRSRLDRDPRHAGSAHRGAHRGGAFLGGGIRCALRLPGHGARPGSRPEQHPAKPGEFGQRFGLRAPCT